MVPPARLELATPALRMPRPRVLERAAIAKIPIFSACYGSDTGNFNGAAFSDIPGISLHAYTGITHALDSLNRPSPPSLLEFQPTRPG